MINDPSIFSASVIESILKISPVAWGLQTVPNSDRGKNMDIGENGQISSP
jgi:hypothetical protein